MLISICESLKLNDEILLKIEVGCSYSFNRDYKFCLWLGEKIIFIFSSFILNEELNLLPVFVVI